MYPAFKKGYAECGLCSAPCATCKKCTVGKDKNCFQESACTKDKNGKRDVNDPNCDKDKTKEPSAHFCTSCRQDAYYPLHPEDIQTKVAYVNNQAAMAVGTLLNDAQIEAINDKFDTLNVNDFLRSTIA